MTSPEWDEATVYLTTAEVAARFRTVSSTVHDWRHRGVGPLGIRFGRHVLYPLPEVEAWERQQLEAARREQARRRNAREVTSIGSARPVTSACGREVKGGGRGQGPQ